MKKNILSSTILLLFLMFGLISQISCSKDTPPAPDPLPNIVLSPVTFKLELLLADANLHPGFVIPLDYALLYPGQAMGGSYEIHTAVRYPEKSWVKTFTVTSNERPLWLYAHMEFDDIGDKVVFNCYVNNVLFESRTVIAKSNGQVTGANFGPFN